MNRVKLIEPTTHPIHFKARIVRILSELNQAVRKIFGYDILRKENMGIELGSIGSAIGSVASGVGRGALTVGRISGEIPSAGAASVSGSSFTAPAFEAAPVGGLLNGIGPKLERPLTPIVNEGPVGLIDLKNTMPLQIGQNNPVSELRFDISVKEAVSPEPLSVESVIAEAESILSQARVNPVQERKLLQEADAVAEVNNWLGIIEQAKEEAIAEPKTIREAADRFTDAEPKVVKPAEVIMPRVTPVGVPNGLEFARSQVASPVLKPVVKTENVLGIHVGSQPKLEEGVDTKVNQAVATQPTLEELEREEVVTEKLMKKKTDMMKEEITKEKKRYLVDEPSLAWRIYEIRQAVKKAKIEAKELGLGEKIIGALVVKYMLPEHVGIRSGIVQPNGPDGSYEETIEAVKARQFDSEDQVEDVVLENTPVKEGEDGRPVKDEAVRKVLKYWVVKHAPAHEMVTSRGVKKTVQVPSNQALVFTVRKQKIRVISARDQNRKERITYEEKI